ncbi:MAG: hypothetical protein GXP50_03390 [Deltaproteobacteria bacterium]|nr:hypothetical protein [Deltaproteobacteria bacterium]
MVRTPEALRGELRSRTRLSGRSLAPRSGEGAPIYLPGR